MRSADVVAAKTLAAHSILFAFIGVPAVYYHSFVGSSSDLEAMRASGIGRRVNREVLDADTLASELRTDPRRRTVLEGLRRLLAVRQRHEAFSPYGTQRVERLDDRVLALRRGVGGDDEVLCVVNVSGDEVTLPGVAGRDLLTDTRWAPLVLPPWGTAWLSEAPT